LKSFVIGFEKLVRKSVKPESEEKDASKKILTANAALKVGVYFICCNIETKKLRGGLRNANC